MRGRDAESATVHVYSPPLWRMGQYTISHDGVLRRLSVSYADELRPLELAPEDARRRVGEATTRLASCVRPSDPRRRPSGLQRRVGLALRSRVAGDDAPERAARIWGAEGERWFTPEDPVWRVNADAAMFPGGMAALLLQSLHPLAMAGVAEHSGYKGDPWGRLQRTSHYLAVTTFGTIEDAERSIAIVNAVHKRVRGTDERPAVRRRRPAPAAVGARRRGPVVPRRLPGLRRDAARRPRRPTSTSGRPTRGRAARRHRPADHGRRAGRVLADYRPELESTPAAREATRFMLLNPPVPLIARPGYAPDRRRRDRAAAELGAALADAAVHGPGVRVAAGAGARLHRPGAVGDGRPAGPRARRRGGPMSTSYVLKNLLTPRGCAARRPRRRH